MVLYPNKNGVIGSYIIFVVFFRNKIMNFFNAFIVVLLSK